MYMPKHEYKLYDLLNVVDHTYLKPYATRERIGVLIEEARSWGTRAVCIQPLWVGWANKYIRSNEIDLKLDAVLDFPFGVLTTDQRVSIIKRMAGLVDEVDIVVQIGYVRSGMYENVRRDLHEVVTSAHDSGILIKVIAEDAYTTRAEKTKLYEIICESGADFIKTSTGFAEREFATSIGNGGTGALVENVRLMDETARRLGSKIGIKAAGGIRSYSNASELLEAMNRPLDPSKVRLGMSETGSLVREMIEKQQNKA
jgi:deoxyribose-phosphate aldolase